MRTTNESSLRLSRWGAWAGAAGVFAVAALMVLSPVASAANASVVYRAPFKNLPESGSASIQDAACGHAKITKAPVWSAKHGTFRTAGSATAPPCKVASNGNSYGSWEGSWNTQGGFYFASNGSHSLTFNWKLKLSTSLSTPTYTCNTNPHKAVSQCFSESFLLVEVGYQVFDETNFSQFTGNYVTLASNFSGQSNFSSFGSASNATFGTGGTSSMTVTGTTVANMTGTDAVANDSNEYDYYFVVLALAYAYAYTTDATASAPVTASTAINMGTGGNEFQLASFTIA